jgi:beta-galactosidase
VLHFEGAGQQAAVYVGEHLVGQHVGGYNEFLFDITEVAPQTASDRGLQLAVLCDNSPDTERMPSDLSDFTVYTPASSSLRVVRQGRCDDAALLARCCS